jgi:hypothetical protein
MRNISSLNHLVFFSPLTSPKIGYLIPDYVDHLERISVIFPFLSLRKKEMLISMFQVEFEALGYVAEGTRE